MYIYVYVYVYVYMCLLKFWKKIKNLESQKEIQKIQTK
jgi:hypothetical protein